MLFFVLLGCQPATVPSQTAVFPEPTVALPLALSSPNPLAVSQITLPPTFTPLPSVIQPTATLTPVPSAPDAITPSPIPDAYAGLTIEGLANRSYGQGEFEIVRTLTNASAFTRYLIRYPSDGLTIYGFMNVPDQQPPRATVLLLHGYIDPDDYQVQTYTTPFADALAEAGFLVIHPNYRNHPPSDDGDNPFRIGYAIDVLNLLALVRQQGGQSGPLLQADPQNIHLFGHSMGGGIGLRVITVDQGIKTAVLYGAMSGDERLNYERIATWSRADATSWELVTPDEDMRRISPIYHLDRIETAVAIHHGSADTVVPPEWSTNLCQQLTILTKNVTCFTYPNQPHNFSGAARTTLIERAIAQFTN